MQISTGRLQWVSNLLLVLLLLLPPAVLAQSQGTVSTSGGSGAAGSTFSIPVTLSLNDGVQVDELEVAVEIISNNGSPQVDSLLFAQDSSLPAFDSYDGSVSV